MGQIFPIERNGTLIKMSEKFSHCCSSENTELKSSKFCSKDFYFVTVYFTQLTVTLVNYSRYFSEAEELSYWKICV